MDAAAGTRLTLTTSVASVIYGLSDAAPYAGFERRKALVARGRLVQVMVQNSVVILEGSVDSADAKAAAGRLAWATPGVFDVCTMLVADR